MEIVKNILSGLFVGVANVIPGVSGGTIIVILGLFDKLMNAITNVFRVKISFKDRLKNLWFIIQLLIGAGIGIVLFAKLINYLFVYFSLQTLSLFAGFTLFSIPMLKREEIPKEKINFVYVILGVLLIGTIAFLSTGKDSSSVIPYEKLIATSLTIPYLLKLVALGAIAGGTMIFPGVSGSMILLVLGWYSLFNGYVANVTTFNFNILAPIAFIGMGVILGIGVSAKATSVLLEKYKKNTMSFIFGLILMSSIVIMPSDKTIYTTVNVITSIIAFFIGGGLIVLLEKVKNQKLKEQKKIKKK